MEILDTQEQKVVNLIVDTYLDATKIENNKFDGIHFNNLLIKTIPHFSRLKKNKDDNSYQLFAKQDNSNQDSKEILNLDYKLNMIYLDLIQCISFLNNLEEERLIIIQGRQRYYIDLKGDSNNNSKEKELILCDKSICSLIDKYWLTDIIPTRGLIELKNNNFKTPEQRRFDRQMSDTQDKFETQMKSARKATFISWAAFVVAFISTLIQIYITITSENTIKIDEPQIESIINSIREDKTNMYPPIEISFKDTVKVRNVDN